MANPKNAEVDYNGAQRQDEDPEPEQGDIDFFAAQRGDDEATEELEGELVTNA